MLLYIIYDSQFVPVFPCSNIESRREDPYRTFWKSSRGLIELASINKVSLVEVSYCSKPCELMEMILTGHTGSTLKTD